MTYDYDLLVIGGGSGGVRGARMAAATGAKVGLVEGDSQLSSTCPFAEKVVVKRDPKIPPERNVMAKA